MYTADQLVVIQQRAPVQSGWQGQFAKEMLEFIFAPNEVKAPKNLLILASTNAAMRRDQFIQGEQVFFLIACLGLALLKVIVSARPQGTVSIIALLNTDPPLESEGD